MNHWLPGKFAWLANLSAEARVAAIVVSSITILCHGLDCSYWQLLASKLYLVPECAAAALLLSFNVNTFQ